MARDSVFGVVKGGTPVLYPLGPVPPLHSVLSAPTGGRYSGDAPLPVAVLLMTWRVAASPTSGYNDPQTASTRHIWDVATTGVIL